MAETNSAPSSKPVSSLQTAPLLSRLFFLWATPLIRLASKQTLQLEDLWALRESETATVSGNDLETQWNQQRVTHGEKAVFSKAVRNTWRFRYLRPLLWSLLWVGFGCASGAVFMRALLVWLENGHESTGYAFGFSVLLTISEIFKVIKCLVTGTGGAMCGCVGTLQSLSQNQMWYTSSMIGIQMRSAIRAMVFSKAMKLRGCDISVGNVVTLALNDSQRLLDMGTFATFLFLCPFASLLIIAILLYILGPSILAGLGVMLVLVPVQKMIAGHVGKARRAAVPITAQRTSVMNEALNGIKLIKLYAWEGSFADRIAVIRRLEVKQLFVAAVFSCLQGTVSWASPSLVTFATFAVNTVWSATPLSPSQAFVTVALLNILRFAFSMLPFAIRTFTEGLVAMKRIESFLRLPEACRLDAPIDLDDVGSAQGSLEAVGMDPSSVVDSAIVLQSASFVWKKAASQTSQPEPMQPFEGLRDVTLNVRRGELIAVVGSVGSGKSTLLAAILGELLRTEGFFACRGKIGYAAQTPWIFNESLRENVLFGSAFDAEWFQRVLSACALEPDLDVLPARDLTEIGERGINLSGGQKARIALARVVYSSTDVVLLDDPLSAVDAHVGQWLWTHCIKDTLKERTRVLVTHQLQYLSDCDRIVVMDKGRVAHVGSFRELEAQGVDWSSMLKPSNPVSDEAKVSSGLSCALSIRHIPLSGLPGSPSHRQEPQSTCPSENSGTLVTKEQRVAGALQQGTLSTYVHAAGGVCSLVVVGVLVAATVVARVAPDYWLSYWVKDAHDRESALRAARPDAVHEHVSQTRYVWVFGMLVAILIVTRVVEGVVYATLTMKASRRLHDDNFKTVLHGTMAYFDTTPLGRILNRFSGDLDLVDTRLPDVSEIALQYMSQCAVSLVVICIVFPWFIAPMVPLLVVFYFIARVFRNCARELKRLEGATKSPLVSNVQASVQGIVTIRAYGRTASYCQRNNTFSDVNASAYFSYYTSNRWVAVRLDWVVVSMVFATALLCVFAGRSLPASMAGLSLTYALQMGATFQFAVRQMSEAEATLTSVERICTPVPQEPMRWHATATASAESSDSAPVSASWPAKGTVCFENVALRYRPHLRLALDRVSFAVQAAEKIGVVGRTGSGKSTLGLALFRVFELHSGRIVVDGVDIGSVPVHTLRDRMSIIPQDPVLFCGTIRKNLDPFQQYKDEDLWRVLDQVNLKAFVESDPDKLMKPVMESGSNFSAGQRQLLCLARALLKRAKIVVMDEATAAVDVETDAGVQSTVRTCFQDSTLFIIAHRLHTVMDCDKVLVMNDGKVWEFAPPAVLLGLESAHPSDVMPPDGASIFQALVQETGIESAAALMSVAARSFRR